MYHAILVLNHEMNESFNGSTSNFGSFFAAFICSRLIKGIENVK